MGLFLQIPQVPKVPDDYGYVVALFGFLVALLLGGAFFITRKYFKYRDDADAKRDKADELREAERKQEWRDAEAARVAARERLHGEIKLEFTDIRADTKELFGTLADENKALREQVQALSERILRLEFNQQPPKEGGK